MNEQKAIAALTQLKATQLSNAKVIVQEFLRAGLPLGVALAAIPNAMAESALNQNAVGDGGNSVGLFQINSLGGARTFAGDRRDPAYNTQWIAEEYKRWSKKKGKIANFTATESLDEAYNRGATVAEMTGLFAAIVERPTDQVGEKTRREALARKMFGALADAPANRFGRPPSPWPWIALSAGLVAIAGGYFLYRRKSSV